MSNNNNLKEELKTPYSYVFPAIRGIQAGREYFVSMCPLRLIPRFFLFDEEYLAPEIRAQRILNRGRLPQMAKYILENQDNYVFSAITASIDADVQFVPLENGDRENRIGLLNVPMSARFIINDGQHRRAAIEMALRDTPELGDETIAVVFFLDLGLKRCQQMFADLNRHAIRPSKSLGVLYDHRDEKAELARLTTFKSPLFRHVVEMERSTLSTRSRKLFTLSAIYSATSALVGKNPKGSIGEQAEFAVDFWSAVTEQFPDWQLVCDGKISASEIRRDFIHSHALILHSLGKVGHDLVNGKKNNWKHRLQCLKKIDWSRSNAKLWEGRAMIGGRVSNSQQNLTLTTNAIKQYLKLPLTSEEEKVEEAYKRGSNEQS